MDRRRVKWWLFSINLMLLLLFFCPLGHLAFGDSCGGWGGAPAESVNGRYEVSVQFDEETGNWAYVWKDTKKSETLTGPLKSIERHAHLYLFITQDGSRFAVLDPIAGHRLNDRLLIYQSDGKLVRTFSIEDLLTKYAVKKVLRSKSHIRWLKYDKDKKSYVKYDPKKETLQLTIKWNRRIRVSLMDGKILKERKKETANQSLHLTVPSTSGEF